MRIVKVQVSNELILQMLHKGWNTQFTECIEGLPEGSEFVYSMPSDDGRGVYFYVTHPSFAEVVIGREVPNLYVTFKRFYYPEVEALLKRLKEAEPTQPQT